MLRKRTIFMGRWLRHGGQYPAWHLRLFRTGRGRCEARLYDQHFVVDGRIGRLQDDYVDVITSDLAPSSPATTGGPSSRPRRSCAPAAAPRPARGGRRGCSARAIERQRFLRTRVYQRFPLFVRPFLFCSSTTSSGCGFLDGGRA